MIYIEIYTKKNCPYCQKAKMLLIKKKLDFNEILIKNNHLSNKKYIEMYNRTGKKTVPQIFINNQYIGGSDDLILFNAQGKLDNLLISTKS